MKKKILAILLTVSIILTSLSFTTNAATQPDGEPSIEDGWQIIDFTKSVKYTGESYKVAVSTLAEAWHHSDNYWSFTWNNVKDTFKISDSEMKQLSAGRLQSDKISKYITAEIELPYQIKAYLNNGGKQTDIKIQFDSGTIEPDEIFSGKCYYKIEGTKLKVAFKPVFNVSDKPIYGKIQDPKMQTMIPQGKPGYSFTTYAIWTKDGKDIMIPEIKTDKTAKIS
ncbi:MAG: hypothetical protein GXX10_09240 [Clostridiaceae bacterium]|nr:hypothetical protein [Clostridiaceae bacterium]